MLERTQTTEGAESFTDEYLLPPEHTIQTELEVGAVALQAELRPIIEDERPVPMPLPASSKRQVRTRTRAVEKEYTINEDPVTDYLDRIARYPLLTAEQEIELSKQFEAGVFAREKLETETEDQPLDPTLRAELAILVRQGERAFTAMEESNLRLVVSVARRYTGRGMDLLDLVQEGNIGLHRAVQKFDYQKGYKFSTYATWWIRQALTRSLADQARTIRLPVHVVEQVNKINRTSKEMQVAGDDPTPEALAEKLGLKTEKVEELLRVSQPLASIHSKVGSDEDVELGDLIEDGNAASPAEVVAKNELPTVLGQILKDVARNERDLKVLSLRYGLDDGTPRTLDEVGKIIGLTRERVRQIEALYIGSRPGQNRILNHPLGTALIDYLY